MREGRLAPGGRGLLDVRLPRATPTWIARLDERHMAFLKDHKVENHVIFPAAAFVEMVLEAGVQLFEGRPFVVEDFEIRKPLILPDPPSGLQLEFSYDPTERTFAIQSRSSKRRVWSLHVVGSMRGERTESAFAASTWAGRTGDLEPVGARRLLRPHERSGACATARSSGRSANCRRAMATSAGRCPCPTRSRIARASIRCIRCSSTERCKFSPPARRRSKVAAPDEAAGALCAHPVPPLAGRGQPGARRSEAVQR